MTAEQQHDKDSRCIGPFCYCQHCCKDGGCMRRRDSAAPLPETGRIEVEEQWGRQQRIELLELALEQYAMRPGADGEIARIALKGTTPLSATQPITAEELAHLFEVVEDSGVKMQDGLWAKLEALVRGPAARSTTGQSADRQSLDMIYSTLRGIPEAMESVVAPPMDAGRMAYWTAKVRDALRLATPLSAIGRSE